MKPNRNETERQQARAEDALFGAVNSLESVEECRAFFKDLCTPAELQALVDRYNDRSADSDAQRDDVAEDIYNEIVKLYHAIKEERYARAD